MWQRLRSGVPGKPCRICWVLLLWPSLKSDFSLYYPQKGFLPLLKCGGPWCINYCLLWEEVNRARCLSAVDASEHGNLSSPWKLALCKGWPSPSATEVSIDAANTADWLLVQSPIWQQWTTSSVIWKLITDLQYRFAFFPKHKWNFLSKSFSGWFRYMSRRFLCQPL